MQTLNLRSKLVREESRIKTLLWPDMRTLPGIESAIDNRKVVAFAIAGISLLLVILKAIHIASLLDVFLYAGLGYGMKLRSRTCANFALILYSGAQV